VTFSHPVDVASVSSDNLTLTAGTLSVDMQLLTQPNPRTLLLQPVGGTLEASTTYTFAALTTGTPVENTDGDSLVTGGTATFVTASPSGLPVFETTHYLKTLAITGWERFPLTGPTAGAGTGSRS
jgi:hypothetical protein